MKLSSRILSLILAVLTVFSLTTQAVFAIDEPAEPTEAPISTEVETSPAPADEEAPAEVPAESDTPVEIPEVEPTQTPSEPVASPEATEAPADDADDTTTDTAPVETPADASTDTPKETPADVTEEAPADTPEETPVETPDETASETIEEESDLAEEPAMDGAAPITLSAPELKEIKNRADGVQITWSAVTGAKQYLVLRKTDKTEWKPVGDSVTGTSFTDKTAASGTTYTYTVCCVDSDGETRVSDHDTEGLTIRFLDAPKCTSLANYSTGVVVTWGAIEGAGKYRVFRKTETGSWKTLTTTTDTTYTDTTAVSGTTYYYSVHCVNDAGTLTSASYRSAAFLRVAAPKISSIYNQIRGVRIYWNSVTGAERYCVMRKTEGGSWQKISDPLTDTTYVDATAKAGTKYYYTIRCVSADGRSNTSGYYAGTAITRVTAPTVSSVENTENGVCFTWKKVSEAESYRILRKSGSGDWKTIAETTGTTYYDTTAPANTTVSYSVRAVRSDGYSSYDWDGLTIKTPSSTYYNAPLAQTVTKLTSGSWKKVNSQWYYYVNGSAVKNGLYSIGGYTYLFNSSGVMQTGWVINTYKTADGKTHTARSYFDSSGHRKESGWGKRNSQWCYFVNGFTVVDCLYTVSGVTYLFDKDGIMQTGWVKDTIPDQTGKLTSVWCYFKSSGARIENGWSKINSTWYYFVNGACLSNTDYKIDGSYYHFNSDCSMYTGWLTVSYTGSDGKTHSGSSYYQSSGARCETGCYKIGSYYYYFKSAILQHGWINTASGDRLYAYESGRLRTGWWQNDGHWYYFNVNGKLATGWKTINGSTYYFYKGTEENGGPKWTMATSTTIDGYKVSSSGTASIPIKTKLLSEAQNHISSTNYLIVVDSVQCRLGIFTKNSSGGWDYLHYISCAPGKASTPTYKGVYTVTSDRGYYFDSGVYRCYYYTTFNGSQAFHSVLYYPNGSLANGTTGYRLSHGCVRVSYYYAKWIFNNIPNGTTTVVI